MSETPRHVCLVDGSGYIFRAFFALPPMNRPDGTPVNAVFGFCTMMLNLMDQFDAGHIGVIFDRGRHSFRQELYPDYKGNRPDTPEELIPQFALIEEAVRAFDLPLAGHEGFEADDLIATYATRARQAGAEVTIVSSDKDLMQLVGDGVSLWDPIKNRRIGPDQVREKFGVPPEQVIDVQALAGDSSDNVPGVPGIGVKTAAELIGRYGSLEALLDHAAEIPQPKRRERLTEGAALARLSKQLVTLRRDAPLDPPLEGLARRPVNRERMLEFFRAQNFRRLVARFSEDGGEANAATDPPAAPDGARDYSLVQDEDSLRAWVAEAAAAGQLAVDTETTGLDQSRAGLVGISLCVRPGRACYIPLAHQAPDAQEDLLETAAPPPAQIPLQRALDILKPLLEDPAVLKVGQNIKYDMTILARHGIALAPVDDTMLVSFVLDGGRHGHGLDELSKRHLDHTPIAFKDVAGRGKTQVTFDRVGLEAARDYAAEDADLTLRLFRKLKPRLPAERAAAVYETIERPLIGVLAAMEQTGIAVDPARLKELGGQFSRRLAELEAEVHKLAGREFNIASPKQLGEVLFGELGLTGGRKTRTGDYSTDAAVLESLAHQHPVAARLLDWRMLAKLKSTYTDALLRSINPETGRLHTSYAMTGAQTGRLSSTDPNLQNIPVRTAEGRQIREAFVAPPGRRLLSLDYSQIELRILAALAGIPALQEAFRQGRDIHAMTASEVFGVPVEGMDPLLRRKAKAINFGIIYGISAFGLANQLGVSRAEAGSFIERYFTRFPGIRGYMDDTVALCRKQGYVETLHGRRIHLEAINDRNPARRNYAERQAINAPVQGTAADIIKRAMIRIPPALRAAGLEDARMLLQVHDELLFEVAEDRLDAAVPVIRQVMEEAAGPARALSVPLAVESGDGANWREAH